MKITFPTYNPRLKERARYLRNNSTLSEVLLWNELKRKQMMGYDFHRQKPISQYIVDFYCLRLSLAIEVDGNSHLLKKGADALRQERLEDLGLRFLRFDDLDIKIRMPDVLDRIREWIQQHASDSSVVGTHPCPPHAGYRHRSSADIPSQEGNRSA